MDFSIKDHSEFKEACDKVYAHNFEPFLSGRKEIFMGLMAAYFCRGHVLLEGPPGTAKTLLAKLFAKTISKSFKRVQFTKDLNPDLVTGNYYYHQGTGNYKFLPGPLFTDVLLADEINRAPPVTQSAFLEAMEERQVTVKGDTIELGDNFFVIATQNFNDYLGTFPLPEVQLDRFIFSYGLNTLTRQEEVSVVEKHLNGTLPPKFSEFDSINLDVFEVQKMLRSVVVERPLIDYAARVVESTRGSPLFLKGASFRAILSIIKGSQMSALLDGRLSANVEDVKNFIMPALRHRLHFSPEGSEKYSKVEGAIFEIMAKVKAPQERADKAA